MASQQRRTSGNASTMATMVLLLEAGAAGGSSTQARMRSTGLCTVTEVTATDCPPPTGDAREAGSDASSARAPVIPTAVTAGSLSLFN